MRKLFGLFRVKPGERLPAAFILLLIVAVNVLFIHRMSPFFQQVGFGPYWNAFCHEFHLSGYDPLTYKAVTEWDLVWNVFRHPLLAWFVGPLYWLNEGLQALVGVNCVQYVVAVLLGTCSFYSFIFFFRILHELLQLGRRESMLLSALFFSMAYVMLSVIVPDHFTPSMMLLLLTFYVSGRCMQRGRELRWWQSLLLFVLTAGVTLSNGIKTFLSGLFVNGRRFFRPKYLLLAVLLPAALMWSFAQWEYKTYVHPREVAREALRVQKEKEREAFVASLSPEQRQVVEQKQERRKAILARQAAKTGKPMKNAGFLKWTDTTTPRWQTTYENLFGESIQFHQQHFLGDTLVGRPVFVAYDWAWSYVVEGVLMLLFLMGVWCGQKSRLLWLLLACFGFDMTIHMVLGFGINEIFIMSPLFLFVIPIAMGYLLLACRGSMRKAVQAVVGLLALYLFIYNMWLLGSFLLTPVQTVF